MLADWQGQPIHVNVKITLYSPSFHPRTGGLENVVLDLAQEFSRAGHAITVLTNTPAQDADIFPFEVLRNPGFWNQVKTMRQADLVLQFNVSLKGLLPWLPTARPLVVSHQTANWTDLRGRLKTWVANHLAALNIGCSQYMSNQFFQAITIPNPYDDNIFRVTVPWEQRTRDLIFVGRLVSDKGADMLLEAMAVLRQNGQTPTLSLAGTGPEAGKLQAMVRDLGMEEQVRFVGLKKGAELADLVNQHRIMVIPSIWDEPFGIVALEGLACGCLVIGSSGGGLPEAIGGLGLTYPNQDAGALAVCLQRVLDNPAAFLPHPKVLEIHLNRHRRAAIAQEYLTVLARMVESSSSQKAISPQDSLE